MQPCEWRRLLNVELLERYLARACRHGAGASRLVTSTPGIIDLLLPAERYPRMGLHERAIQAEALIREAARAIGGVREQAILILLRLMRGLDAPTLTQRRSLAARYLDRQANTVRNRHESALMFDLTMEIYRLHISQPDH